MIKRRLGVYTLLTALVLALLSMISVAASAEEAPVLSPMLAGWLEQTENGDPVSTTLSASLHALVPYGEEMLSMMNRLLSQYKLNVIWQKSGDAETTWTQLFIGNEAAVDILEQSGEQALAQTSLLPGVTLAGTEESPISQLLGEENQIPFWASDIPNPTALAQTLPDALSGLSAYMVEKEGSFNLLSVVTARKALTYTVPKEEVAPLRDMLVKLASNMNWPEATALFSTVTLQDDAQVTLYKTREGETVGFGIKAAMGFENVSVRKVNFLWAFKSDAKKTAQSVSLKSPASEGSDYLTVTGSWQLESKKAKNTLSFGLDMKSSLNKKAAREQWSGKLDCLLADDNQRLEGEIKQTVTDPEDIVHTLVIQPSLLAYRSGEDVSVKGNARIAWSLDKAVQTDVTVSLAADKYPELTFGNSGETISLDAISPDERRALAQKVQSNAVSAIWRAVLLLPEESLALIKKNITQAGWETIIQAGYQVGQ